MSKNYMSNLSAKWMISLGKKFIKSVSTRRKDPNMFESSAKRAATILPGSHKMQTIKRDPQPRSNLLGLLTKITPNRSMMPKIPKIELIKIL